MDSLHTYVVVAQLPIVAFLIIANVQAVGAFKCRPFYLVAAAWLSNFVYLAANNVSLFGLVGVTHVNERWWGAVGDGLDLLAAYLFWLAYWHRRRVTQQLLLGGVFAILMAWQVIVADGIDPVEQRLAFIIATAPSVVAYMSGLWALRKFYVSVTRAPASRRAELLLSVGVGLYLIVQPVYLFKSVLPSAAPNVGFLCGAAAKSLIGLGLVAAFIAAAELGVRVDEREERVKALSATIGRLTHELGTPIAQMTLHVDNLITAAPGHGAFARHLESLENAVLRVNAILASARQLLPQPEVVLDLKQYSTAFRRIPQFAEEQVVSLNNLVQLALMAVKETRDERIVTTVRYAGNCCIRCVPIDITQAVINVLRNAYDAYPSRRGKIILETANLRRDGEGDDFAQIRVTDNGEGIRADMLDRVFTEGVTTRDGGGRGYGLAVVKSMVEKNRGAVALLSNADGPATGTVVTMQFPRVPCS